MTEIRAFADAVGRKRIAEALNVGATAVSNHVVRGAFPASWFLVLRELAEQVGVECPVGLFEMRQMPKKGSSQDFREAG